jgi:hypothetical protein
MTSPADATPPIRVAAESATFDAFHLIDADSDDDARDRDISERRARQENPEALRLGRAV